MQSQKPESSKPNQAIENIFKEKNEKEKPDHCAAALDDTILFLFTKNNKAKKTPLIKPLYVECFHMVFKAISRISR